MEYYITELEIRNYLKLPQTFENWSIVDQDSGFGKIFKVFPEDIYLSFKDSDDDAIKEIFRLLTKAATHYAFILSLPRIKTHITNFGLIEFNSDKTKTSAWWDIRDLGLSFLKEADRCFSEAITKAKDVSEIYSSLPFFVNKKLIETPGEFEEIYSIGNSVEVFLSMQQFIDRAHKLIKREYFKTCNISELNENEEISDSIKQAVIYIALYYASKVTKLVFLQSAIAFQYDELPWQKSMILSQDEKLQAGQNLFKLGKDNLKDVVTFISENKEDFPCYTSPAPEHIQVSKPSGLYLI